MKETVIMLGVIAFAIASTYDTKHQQARVESDLVEIDERLTAIEQELELPIPQVSAEGVRVTYYEPVAEQCWGNPLITANGSRIDTTALRAGKIRWVAVSRDMERLFPMGSTIKIYIREGHAWNGLYQVNDRTSARLSKTIDILSNTFNGGCYKGTIKLSKL